MRKLESCHGVWHDTNEQPRRSLRVGTTGTMLLVSRASQLIVVTYKHR